MNEDTNTQGKMLEKEKQEEQRGREDGWGGDNSARINRFLKTFSFSMQSKPAFIVATYNFIKF